MILKILYLSIKKNNDSKIENIYNVEILGIKEEIVKNENVIIVQMKVEDLDCSEFDDLKKISWNIINGDIIITLVFNNDNIVRKYYTGNQVYWNWNKNRLDIDLSGNHPSGRMDEEEIEKLVAEAEKYRLEDEKK
uniref:Uncharacterized protein n=1 Tax=viral metagenome TaxID=1070528 RepID=A0A6C0AE70_9ZZZZ